MWSMFNVYACKSRVIDVINLIDISYEFISFVYENDLVTSAIE